MSALCFRYSRGWQLAVRKLAEEVAASDDADKAALIDDGERMNLPLKERLERAAGIGGCRNGNDVAGHELERSRTEIRRDAAGGRG